MAAKTLTARAYSNPVPYADGKAHTAPDPFVIRYRGTYYCYATDEHGVLVSTSPDMVHWQSHGYCYTEAGRKNFWAPSVILLNGVFHMYFSNMPEEETDTHTEIMRVCVSADPLGPFEKKAELFGTFAIDSQVVMGDDGQLYLLYADNQAVGLSDVRPGTSVMIDRLVTPYRREGAPRPLILPTMDEEIFARNRFGDGRDWHTVEGATYFAHRDKAFITYSANAYEHEDYFVGYTVAGLPARPADTHIDELAWLKQLNNGHFDPLLIRSDKVEGTGHNSIVKAPNGVDDWIVYHGRNAADELYVGTEQRVMRIDPLYYAEGLLDTDGPTDDERDAPLAAGVTADFAAGVPAGWTVRSGEAAAAGSDGAPALAIVPEGRFDALSPLDSATQTIGVWAKGQVTPLGAEYGLIVRYADENNRTDVIVDMGRHRLLVVDIVAGIRRCVATSLPADLDMTTWHELVAIRAYGQLEVRVDDRHLAYATISAGEGASGLTAVATAAEFSAFRATDHVDLWGSGLADMSHEIVADGGVELSDQGLGPRRVRPVSWRMTEPADGNRYVLDFALDSDAAEVLIGVDGYRIALTGTRAEVLRDGVSVEGNAEPVRLREVADDVRRDEQGRALRTIRIAVANDTLRIHMRGHGWSLPFDGVDEDCIQVTLDRSRLIGYTRTSLAGHEQEGA